MNDEKTLAMLCHLGGALGHFFGIGNVVIPLIIWLIKKDESSFIDQQGREVLNFQITILLAELVIGIVATVLTVIVIGVFLYFLIPLVALVGIILGVVGAVKTNNGESFSYPFTLRLL